MEDPDLTDVGYVEKDAELHRSIMLTHNALLIEL